MEKTQKIRLTYSILFSVLAIAFALLYYFGLVKFLDNYLALIYIFYFTGLALMFTAGYLKNSNKLFLRRVLYLISALLVIGSTAMLIYGLAMGYVDIVVKF